MRTAWGQIGPLGAGLGTLAGPRVYILGLPCSVAFAPSLHLRSGENAISRGTTKSRPQRRRIDTRSAVARPVARELATLALSWVEQEEKLLIRQQEQLRRALASAAEFLEWTTLQDHEVDKALRDMKTLAEAGVRFIAKDLEQEVADKKTESTRLKKAATSIQKLAATADFETPVEFSYAHTAREGDGLVTKTEDLTFADAEEAERAARTIENKLDSWERLRTQMLEDLKRRQEQLEELKERLAAFAESFRGLVVEVFAILY